MMNKNDLRKSFDELPDKIREWLTSERATYIIVDINERLGMAGPLMKIIPNTVLRLVTKDIEPGEFINILSWELGVDFGSAKNIAQEIEEKILRPIEGPLRREADIDIKLIYFSSPVAPQPAPPQVPASAEATAGKPIAIRVEPPKVVEPPFPQNRPTFQPIRPPIIKLPINIPKGPEVPSD